MGWLGEYAWVVPAAAAFAVFVVTLRGYRHPGNGAPAAQSMMSGAMLVSSKIAEDILAQMTEQVIQARRHADAAEALVEIERGRDKRKSQERHDSELETLRRKVEELERGKR